MVTRGFTGRRQPPETGARLPPGQYLTQDFPILQIGPNPSVDLATWQFTLRDGSRPIKTWSWEAMQALPQTTWHGDIHCVTKWSKFDTTWEGVTFDDLLTDAGIEAPTEYLLAESYDDYSTNIPVADLTDGKAMIALRYDGQPIHADHGGPARFFVPHLYFWKSAKWLKGLRFTKADTAGYWELRGYHMYGDPWREQRYIGD
ncbi:sulfite oxidase-like oxidoreductase [Methylobacterium aerolatum]|uniref:DMSO/TMAO reductase YedYZ molybdopterin-dependent catalytic subunit n=1 Tax=Methylobacterium aerolatum TaxID=418708 RepID=A0ABU0HZA2_9HYPH|nr:sulfite oxidase-like oxidoreductase [Methylobacterium aerolatum]MDQ0447660.1 DMSO/TMAO reductase YedYZ molybdopterin-dependent catalytic subunit [Methylobacterium aerolatum]GJD34760.1 Protein-methionine-sulfoxide reductase catalytic subunit MsrP [Methylobacterium aerolatum]